MENKKILQIKAKLKEAIFHREKAKIRYDAHVLILEGNRRTLSELESMNQELMTELMSSGNAVSEINFQLQTAVKEGSDKIEAHD